MRLKLSRRFNLYIGGILLIGIAAFLYHDYRSNEELLKGIGINEARRLCETAFDDLYASMRRGGTRADDKAVIERFRKMEGVEDTRIIHGRSIDGQYGIEEDELPLNEIDRAALDGFPASAAQKDGYGYSSASFAMPFFIKEECRGCHIGGGNDVGGAISVTVSLKRYRGAVSAHWKKSMFWGGFIFVLTSGAVLLTVHRRFVAPLEILKEGVDSLAAGDLSHRVGIRTGDEIEDLGSAFDRMAASLHAATADLEELNEKHSMVVQMAADAIVLKDCGTKRFVDANPAAVNLTGYSREELLKMRFEDMFPPDKLPEYREIFKRWYHDGKGYLYGAVVIKKDGFTVPVEIAASVMELNGKKYIQEIWRDLSERKGFEEAIRRHIEELEGTVRERTAKLNKSLSDLGAAYKRLQESEQMFVESAKLISLGEMGASIAHELNSPLAGILSITEVLLGRLRAEDPSRFMLEKIKDAAVRSKYIIVDMMTYARPSKGAYEPMFLNESIRATLTLFISELKTSSIEIHEDFDPDLPKIIGNKGQIMEVILNIIKNARDVMRGTGRIFISTRAVAVDGKDFAVAEIRDTGPGIPAEIMDKIFDPFFTTKEKGGGLNIGLGLSISRSIVNAHGGSIQVESRPGEGATFRMFLPLSTPAARRAV